MKILILLVLVALSFEESLADSNDDSGGLKGLQFERGAGMANNMVAAGSAAYNTPPPPPPPMPKVLLIAFFICFHFIDILKMFHLLRIELHVHLFWNRLNLAANPFLVLS